MRYKIFDNGEQINTIEADFLFVAAYCQSAGYTFEEDSLPDAPASTPEPTTEERLAALENENKLLKEQVSAQADQAEFYENCIAEMAEIVYA